MIRMTGLDAMPIPMSESVACALDRVASSGNFVLGPEVDRFEELFSTWTGVRRVVGVGNGLDALALGMLALGIGPGDEVITTPMTAFATVLAIVRIGATPVFADIDIQTGLMSIQSAQRSLSKRTKAIVVVHLYGHVKEMKTWVDLCESEAIFLIEDCAQAHGAREDGIHCGGFGIFGAFSFYPTKNLGALGDAGAVVTGESAISESVKRLRNYGQTDRYHHVALGLNSRLDEIQAAVLSEKLRWLDSFTIRRRHIAERYLNEIRSNSVETLMPPLQRENHSFHLFVVRTHSREDLASHLLKNGVESLIHYPVPAHKQSAIKEFRADPRGLANAERHAEECLSIPCHPGLSDDDVSRVVRAINDFGS